MEFVPVKSVEQQDIQSLVRIGARLIHRQTALVKEMRGLLAECGMTIGEGITPFRSKMAEWLMDQLAISLGSRRLFLSV